MIRLKLFLLAASLVLTACSDSPAPPLNQDYPLTKITERVYVIPGPPGSPNKQNQGFINNPGFVITDKGVVVIDPGSSRRIGQMVLDKIHSVTQAPVIAVFNTHIHGDHWLANCAIRAAYPQAVIYAHPAMISKIAAGEGESWVNLLNRLTEGALKETQIVAPNLGINDGEMLKLGGLHFRIYHNGKAHTDTDIMIEVAEEKVMFLGDNLSFGRTPRLDDGDFKGNIAALDIALKSDAQYFIAGHGKSGGREIPRAFSAYLAALYGAVKKYYTQGISDFAMKPKITQELAAYKDWAGFDEGLGRLISLAYLQIEADSFK
ncbi:MAG TPA: MBL fold metallo-hydrolase [Acidiferrobacterales bacterium]|nr:MBL fold metallo-hydrolase [Acidiferrobacterales bacterium]